MLFEAEVVTVVKLTTAAVALVVDVATSRNGGWTSLPKEMADMITGNPTANGTSLLFKPPALAEVAASSAEFLRSFGSS